MAVHVYKSTDLLAPTHGGAAAGGLLTVLDACLVNGYATVAWAGAGNLVQTGNVATFTATSAHGLVTGDHVTVAGANQADYNITALVTVTSGTVFTYPIANNPASPATTGTSITCKKASAQYTINQTGTNIRNYKASIGNQFCLGVDDTNTSTVTRLRGYASATAAGVAAASGTDPMPTDVQLSGGLYCGKAAVSYWVLVSNRKMIYYFLKTTTTNTYGQFAHGDFTSYVNADAYNTILCGQSNVGTTSGLYPFAGAVVTAQNAALSGKNYTQRGYNQVAVSTSSNLGLDTFRNNAAAISGDTGSAITIPSPTEGGINLSPFWITEGISGIRGHMPGIWAIHGNQPFTENSAVYGTGNFAGKTFWCVNPYSTGQLLIETSDTWA